MRIFCIFRIVCSGLHRRPERKERTVIMCEYIPLYPAEETKHAPSAVYAMAFVRMQDWERPLKAGEALSRGTAFSSLVKPFTGKEAAK